MIRGKKKRIAFIYEGVKSEEELFQNINSIFFAERAEISILSFPAKGNIYICYGLD